MTTPADELRAAAAKLRKLTADATPGPWHRPLDTRYKASVNAPLPDGEQGTWIGGVDPETGQRENCTVATIPTWSDGSHARKRNGRDLEYIAAMHPGVGATLAVWLDTEATTWPGDVPHHVCVRANCTLDAALAVARQINGSRP